MLNFAQRIATKLYFLKASLGMLMMVAIILFATELIWHVPGFKDEAWLKPAGMLFLWSMLAWLFLSTCGSIPIEKPHKAGMFKKLKFHFTRGYCYILTLMLVCCSAAIVLISLRFVRAILI